MTLSHYNKKEPGRLVLVEQKEPGSIPALTHLNLFGVSTLLTIAALPWNNTGLKQVYPGSIR